MAKRVELSNGREWSTKTSAKTHFREMLARYKDGDVIDNPADHSDLCALLERYDSLIGEGPSKIGLGIGHFERRLNKGDGWSSSGFWVIRTDGTATDFSFPDAVGGNTRPISQEFYDACHNAVARDLLNMKQSQFDKFADADGKLECDVTGVLVAYSDAHLAHGSPPFGVIVTQFRHAKGWDVELPLGTVTKSGDAQLSSTFTDEAVAQEFKDYHHSVAVMRIVGKVRPTGSATMAATIKRPLRFI